MKRNNDALIAYLETALFGILAWLTSFIYFLTVNELLAGICSIQVQLIDFVDVTALAALLTTVFITYRYAPLGLARAVLLLVSAAWSLGMVYAIYINRSGVVSLSYIWLVLVYVLCVALYLFVIRSYASSVDRAKGRYTSNRG